MYLKFIFDGKNVDEIVDKIVNSKIELDNIGKSEKEKKINEVIMKCLNRDVDNRPDIETISVLFCNEDIINLHL